MSGEMVQLSFRLSVSLARALEQVARENDRTVSGELRRLIRLHVAAQQERDR